jgi:hypothetical protein
MIVQFTEEELMKTKAKRKLIREADILEIKQRVELGVPLNTAVKLLVPDISNVAVIKLVNWHTEMQEALEEEDYVLHDCMHNSLFPSWLPEPQPDNACYVGQFPYGYWENINEHVG